MPMKHLESGTVTTEISIFLHLFLFHGVSLRCFMLFHSVSSLCFMVFQGVSLPCFILFHDHEIGAVGMSLNTLPLDIVVDRILR